MELMSGGKIFDHIIEKVCPTAPALPPAKASIVCCMLDGNNKHRKLEADEQNQAPSVSRPGAACLQSGEKIIAKDRDYAHYFAHSVGEVIARH